MKKSLSTFSAVDGAGVVACLVITVIAYFAAARPLLDRHARVAVMQQTLNVQRQRAATATNATRAAEKELTAIQAAIAKRPLKISPQSYLNQRLSELTTLATKSGLMIQTMQPGVATIGAKYNTVPILLSGRGTYVDLVRYLSELHGQCLDLGVASLKMQGNPDNSAAGATFEINLTWFAMPTATMQTATVQE